jgi:hypothetical protein
VNVDPALIVKYTNSTTVITSGVSSRWYRKRRRTRRPADAASLCCPGGLAAGAGADVGASDDTLAEDYVAIEDGAVSAFLAEDVPSNLFGMRYGATFDLVTMPIPVSVSVGFISPPETLNRNSCMIVSKPCR